MSAFDSWQQWGLALSDRQFADAFTALGVLAADRIDPPPASDSCPPTAADSDMQRLEFELRLKTAVANPLILARGKDASIAWRFPDRCHRIQLGSATVRLGDLDPLVVAKIWADLAETFSDRTPRLCIVEYPVTEPVRVWYRLLSESRMPKSAYIRLSKSPAAICWKWPLRLGFLPGNAAGDVVEEARKEWRSGTLTRPVSLGREEANCDILLFSGTGSQLLKALRESRISEKANLCVVKGDFERDPQTACAQIDAIAAECSASGFVFVPSSLSSGDFGSAVNRFVANLSHNMFIDQAAGEALKQCIRADTVVYLSPDLAAFRIEQTVERLCVRLRRLPRSARLVVQPETLRLLIPKAAPAAGVESAARLADALLAHRKDISFEHESDGAFGFVAMSDAIDVAERESADKSGHARFLQERTFIRQGGQYVEERRALRAGVPSLLSVRVGPPDDSWTPTGSLFPEEELPRDAENWRLTVVFSEPDHLEKPLRATIRLPREGASTVCKFQFTPQKSPLLEGRITVLHRGRVLQTAVLRASVLAEGQAIPRGARITFVDLQCVRSRVGDLEQRRQFDGAFVLNHAAGHRPRLTAIAARHAWMVDLTDCQAVVADINKALSQVAASVEDYSGGLDTDANQALLYELALKGRYLYGRIVIDQFQDPSNWEQITEQEYIQVVSTRHDALIPFEFIYDYETPDPGARLCPHWREALKGGATTGLACWQHCDARTGARLCPLGFWGVRKVIERHTLTPGLARDGRDFFLQSEPTALRDTLSVGGTAVLGASKRVKSEEMAPVLAACRTDAGSAVVAGNWAEWRNLVETWKPLLLLALPHTDGNGVHATLEIGGVTVQSIQIKEPYLRPEGAGTFPLVALLGCDTVGTALEYGSHVAAFRWLGAAAVIATIATVFGKHAVKVAELLVADLRRDHPSHERLGEVLRSLKCRALHDGMVMPLCVVAFGDADWKLDRKEA